MVVLGIGIVWVGFWLASFGYHISKLDDVGLLDLAIPGHYVKSHATTLPGSPAK